MSMRSPAFRDVVVVQLAPGEEATSNVSGALVAVLSASAAFEMALGDDSFFYAAAGLGYRPIGERGEELIFGSLRIRNTGVDPLDVRLQVGTGNIVDNRAVFGGVAVPVQPITFAAPQPVTQSGDFVVDPITFAAPQPVTQSGPWEVGLTDPILPRAAVPSLLQQYSNISVGATTPVLVAAANADRERVGIQHHGTETMYVRRTNATNSLGLHIVPGERLELKVTSDIYIYNPASFDQTVRLYGLEW